MNRKRIKACLVGMILYCMMIYGCTACSAKSEEKVELPVVSESQEQETTSPTMEENTIVETESVQEVIENAQNEEPVIVVKDITIKIGDDLSVLVDSLGEPDDYQAAKSCTGEGDEKVYGYGGISIYTTPSAGQDLVYILELAGEEKLPTGVGLGSSKQDVIGVYGEKYTDDGNYISYEYDNGSITLGFEFEGDIVKFIEIYGAL